MAFAWIKKVPFRLPTRALMKRFVSEKAAKLLTAFAQEVLAHLLACWVDTIGRLFIFAPLPRRGQKRRPLETEGSDFVESKFQGLDYRETIARLYCIVAKLSNVNLTAETYQDTADILPQHLV